MRRRTPPTDQLDALRTHVAAGKPLVGIRTASHSFAVAGRNPKPVAEGLATWPGFDAEVLGGHYHNHHREGPRITLSVARDGTPVSS